MWHFFFMVRNFSYLQESAPPQSKTFILTYLRVGNSGTENFHSNIPKKNLYYSKIVNSPFFLQLMSSIQQTINVLIHLLHMFTIQSTKRHIRYSYCLCFYICSKKRNCNLLNSALGNNTPPPPPFNPVCNTIFCKHLQSLQSWLDQIIKRGTFLPAQNVEPYFCKHLQSCQSWLKLAQIINRGTLPPYPPPQ